MNFDKDYKEFIEWEKTKGGTSGPTEFTAEEDVSIRLFVAYLNCRYAPPSPNQALDSDAKRSYSGDPDNNPRKDVDIFHAPML